MNYYLHQVRVPKKNVGGWSRGPQKLDKNLTFGGPLHLTEKSKRGFLIK